MKKIFDINSPRQLNELTLKYADSFDPQRILDKSDRSKFVKFVNILEKAVSNHKCLLLFRSDRKSLLHSIYGGSIDVDKDITPFFLVGNKAKSYLKDNQEKLKNRNYLRDISDITEDTFDWIFETIRAILRKKKIDSKDLTNDVENFCHDNPDFASFFEKPGNKKILKQFIGNPQLSESIRDYYLYLIHTISSDYLTFLISSSQDANVLKTFCDKNSRDNIVTVFWTPLPVKKYGISQEQAVEYRNMLFSHGLPTYSSNFYPTQHEVSIKGAIFPHFIIGLYDFPSQSFVVSPHILNCTNLELVIPQGFSIDQSGFKEEVEKTEYGRIVLRFYDKTYKDVLV